MKKTMANLKIMWRFTAQSIVSWIPFSQDGMLLGLAYDPSFLRTHKKTSFENTRETTYYIYFALYDVFSSK